MTQDLLLTPDAARFKPLGVFKRNPERVVSLVEDLSRHEKRVARWFAQPGTQTELALLEGLDRVARRLGTLSHPCLPAFDKLVEGQGGTWLLTQYVEGCYLLDYMGAEASVSEGWIAWWLWHLLDALDYLQQQDVMIRYLEPGDVVVRGDRLWICDLGLFEDMFPELGAAGLAQHPSVNFIAPEQRYAVRSQPGADLYSAGALAFWLATGYAPVAGPSLQTQLRRALGQRSGLPTEVAELILQLLAFHPGERPDRAATARDRLRPWTGDLRGHTPPSALPTEIFKARAETTVSMSLLGTIGDRRVPRPWQDTPPPAAATPPRPWRPGKLVVAAAAAVLLLGVAGVWSHRSAGVTVLVTAGGTIHGTPAGTWRAGQTLTAGPSGMSLKGGLFQLSLDPLSTIVCRDDSTVALRRGGLQTTCASQSPVRVLLPGGLVLLIRPRSTATVKLLPVGPNLEVSCARGSAELLRGREAHPLEAGDRLSMAANGAIHVNR